MISVASRDIKKGEEISDCYGKYSLQYSYDKWDREEIFSKCCRTSVVFNKEERENPDYQEVLQIPVPMPPLPRGRK